MEGTTQCDPFAMSMYGIAIIPLIEPFDDCFAAQKWYADNGNTFGSHDNLKKPFFSLKKYGPAFGYHLNKCRIIIKEHLFEKAQQVLLTTKWKKLMVAQCLVVKQVLIVQKTFVESSL